MASFIEGGIDLDLLPGIEGHLICCGACRAVIADAARGALIRSAERTTSEEAEPLSGMADSDPALPTRGDLIAEKYLIEEYLGSGSMGWVVAARHRDLGLRVAIKILRPGAKTSVRRFLTEARICASLSHPNIPRVFDLGRLANGAPFMVMEYLVGQDLATLAAQGPLPIREAVQYLLQACAGLSHAHAAGIVHRDVKPANLFLAVEPGGEKTVKVLDFGISKVTARSMQESVDSATATGVAVGSPLYMSPEQVRARADVDVRSDIWSLGVILYQLTTGRPPFWGPGLPALSVSITVDRPVPPSFLRPDISPALERVILRCLAKAPEARYPVADALARDLAQLGLRGHLSGPGKHVLGIGVAVMLAAGVVVATVAHGRTESGHSGDVAGRVVQLAPAALHPVTPDVAPRREGPPPVLPVTSVLSSRHRIIGVRSPGRPGTTVSHRPPISRVMPPASTTVGPLDTPD